MHAGRPGFPRERRKGGGTGSLWKGGRSDRPVGVVNYQLRAKNATKTTSIAEAPDTVEAGNKSIAAQKEEDAGRIIE
jgi:hypothetical protein